MRGSRVCNGVYRLDNNVKEGLIPARLKEIELLLAGIETKGLMVLPLSELIGNPPAIIAVSVVLKSRLYCGWRG
jgi:hypothetical protein